jgi:hypothetical protein
MKLPAAPAIPRSRKPHRRTLAWPWPRGWFDRARPHHETCFHQPPALLNDFPAYMGNHRRSAEGRRSQAEKRAEQVR